MAFAGCLILGGCFREDDVVIDAMASYHACLNQHPQDAAPCSGLRKSYLAAVAADERS